MTFWKDKQALRRADGRQDGLVTMSVLVGCGCLVSSDKSPSSLVASEGWQKKPPQNRSRWPKDRFELKATEKEQIQEKLSALPLFL